MHQHSNYSSPRRKREKEREWENLWRDFSWKFPQYGKEIVNQVQEAQRVPYRVNPWRNTPRHILIKLTKTKYKGRILKAAWEKQQITYKGNPILLRPDLSAETLQARREWQDIFKVLKEKKSTANITIPGKDLIQSWWRNKSFSEKQKLREFSTMKPALQQMLKGLIYPRNTREEKQSTKSTPNN